MTEDTILIESFLAYTIGIVVYFVGMRLNEYVPFLRAYNIPEPVTGGILAASVGLVVFLATGAEIKYELQERDTFLVYFFTAIGLNARLGDLWAGGRPLAILLVLTLGYIVLQDVVGVLTAIAIGQPSAVGVLAGSASLIGGHGTTIAWAPEIAAKHGVPNALEIGVASATLGLVIASLLGGPIAKFLLARHDIRDSAPDGHLVGIPHEKEDTERINHVSIMAVILTLNVAIIIGYFVNQGFEAVGMKLPFFVSCLLAAIVLSNTVPHLLPRMHWPARTRALALVSDFSLGLFIAMSLMSMQLWDNRRPRRTAADPARRSGGRRRRLYPVRAVPADGPGLHGDGAERRFRRLRPRRDADRDRQHDRGDQEPRPRTNRVHHPAAGGRVFRRHHQRLRHPVLPGPLSHGPRPFTLTKRGVNP